MAVSSFLWRTSLSQTNVAVGCRCFRFLLRPSSFHSSRSYGAQALQVGDSTSFITKKKGNPRSSWDDAAERFFSPNQNKTDVMESSGSRDSFRKRFPDVIQKGAVSSSRDGDSRKSFSGSVGIKEKGNRERFSDDAVVDHRDRKSPNRYRVSSEDFEGYSGWRSASGNVGVAEITKKGTREQFSRVHDGESRSKNSVRVSSARDHGYEDDSSNGIEEQEKRHMNGTSQYHQWNQGETIKDKRGSPHRGYPQDQNRRDSRRDSATGNHVNWRSREVPAVSSLPRIKGEVLYGIEPVYAALQASQRKLFCLYVQENMPIVASGKSSRKKDKKALVSVIRTAIESGLEVKEISKHDLNMLADNKPHQGVVLDAASMDLSLISELDPPFEEDGKAPPVWVALDEVTDPQNFGAILRSAYYLGASGVIISERNSAPLSAVASNASAGALEVAELRACRNMAKFLDKSSANGWRIVGADAAGSDVIPISQLPRGKPTILVLGSEGKGLRSIIKKTCGNLVSVPGFALGSQLHSAHSDSIRESNDDDDENVDGSEEDFIAGDGLNGSEEDFIAVDSLNVSVAAGVLLHELLSTELASKNTIPSVV